jgi:CRISPR-associated protein Cmr5
MSIRSHDLARAAYGVVSARQQLPDDERKKYGALAHKLPSLILQNGLAQATGFLLAKGKNIQATDKDAETETAVDNPSTRPNEHYALLDDLREILHAVRVINSNVTERDDLHKQIIDADMATTMRLTRHA